MRSTREVSEPTRTVGWAWSLISRTAAGQLNLSECLLPNLHTWNSNSNLMTLFGRLNYIMNVKCMIHIRHLINVRSFFLCPCKNVTLPCSLPKKEKASKVACYCKGYRLSLPHRVLEKCQPRKLKAVPLPPTLHTRAPKHIKITSGQ